MHFSPYGFYLHNRSMEWGVEDIWPEVKYLVRANGGNSLSHGIDFQNILSDNLKPKKPR
jgi:hypothetical protein